MKLSKKIGISAIGLTAISLAAATPILSQTSTMTIRNGNFSGPGAFLPRSFGGAFFSYFATNMNNANLVAVSAPGERGRFQSTWDGRSASAGSDAVIGIGWNSSSANRNRNITFTLNRWSRTTNVATMGIYGWRCPAPTNSSVNNIVEYYVVNNWANDVSQFVPFDAAARGNATELRSFTFDGATYKIYRTPRFNAGHGCVGVRQNQNFTQLWAVRQGRKFNRQTVNMGTIFNQWAATRFNIRNGVSVRGNGRRVSIGPSNSGYQIVAIEGINSGNGFADITVSN